MFQRFRKTQLHMMGQLRGSIFNEIIGPFNPFLNSLDNSVELYTEELKKKKNLSKDTKEVKNVLVYAGLNVIGQKLKMDLRFQK